MWRATMLCAAVQVESALHATTTCAITSTPLLLLLEWDPRGRSGSSSLGQTAALLTFSFHTGLEAKTRPLMSRLSTLARLPLCWAPPPLLSIPSISPTRGRSEEQEKHASSRA